MTATRLILNRCYCGLSVDGLACLLTGSLASYAEVLLEGNAFGDEGAALLARWETIAQVEVLNLAAIGLGPSGLRALLSSPARPVELYLDENPLYDEGIHLLAGSPFVSMVHHLSVGCTGIDSAGVQALLESPFLATLQVLELAQTELLEEDWQLLRTRFPAVICG